MIDANLCVFRGAWSSKVRLPCQVGQKWGCTPGGGDPSLEFFLLHGVKVMFSHSQNRVFVKDT